MTMHAPTPAEVGQYLVADNGWTWPEVEEFLAALPPVEFARSAADWELAAMAWVNR